MKKYLFLLCGFISCGYAKDFSEQIIMIEPVSWDELQLLQLNNMKTSEEFSLSNDCPKELSNFENLQIQETYFKEILWTHYYWTNFIDNNGNLCIVKHNEIDFFSQNYEINNDINNREYEILSTIQSRILLSAKDSLGFDQKGIDLLMLNVSKHNSAVEDKKFTKYGGRNMMQQFMRNHEPEFEPAWLNDSKAEVTFIEKFESYYSDKTLNLFKNEIINNPNKDMFNGIYPFESMEELLIEVKGQIKLKEEHKKKLKNKTSTDLTKVPNSSIAIQDPVLPQYNPVYPYSTIGLTSGTVLCNNNFKSGASFLITSYVSLTAAHNIVCGNIRDQDVNFQPGLLTSGQNYFPPFSPYPTSNVKLASNYNYLDPDYIKAEFDYGALRTNFQYLEAGTLALQININTSPVRVVGFPIQRHGMHQGEGNSYFAGNANGNVITYAIKTESGMSGGPILEGISQPSATYAKGVHGWGWVDNGNKVGSGILIDGVNASEITSWLWEPTGEMIIGEPAANVAINLVVIPRFEAIFNAFNRVTIFGDSSEGKDVDEYIEWSSDLDGDIAVGSVVPSEVLKTKLSAGTHYITAKVDSNGEEGEKSVRVTIEVPAGTFNSSDYCIIDLGSTPLNSCDIDISWSVTNTPAISIVWNETDDIEFATGNSGSLPFTATTNTTTFKLYPSDEKIILLDMLNAQAKLPTGNLIAPSAQCSLQPSPVNPDGTMREPRATPTGCGTEISWSNVQWASPSIYYKPVGSGSWQFLHQIPCALDGTICTGSIHTDDYESELIPASGYQFKLVQFNDANSGNLTAPFTVTAKRYADAYEFDDGWYELPDNLYDITNERLLAFKGNISNRVSLNQVQHNHNFHRPAVYDSGIDVDSFDIPNSDLPQNAQVTVEIFNMAAGLDVSFEIQCVGLKDFRTGPFDDIEPIEGVWEMPFELIASNVLSGNKRTMKFNYLPNFTGNVNGQFIDLPSCGHNRVIVKRLSGQASENLTYSFIARVPSQGSVPVIDTVGPKSSNKYKVELIGDNFGTNASVSVRADINGSQPLEVYSSNLFHNQGTHASTHPSAGKDFIRFPIVEVSQQNKFNVNGLCFKVISDTVPSNEICYKRNPPGPQPQFMGADLQSYNHTNQAQDIDNDAYIVKSNGSLMKLWGNSWKKIPFNYTVTSNTEVEFDFGSTLNEGEISGVGFIMNGESNLSSTKFWQFHGTESWGNQEHNDYSGAGYKTYKINIGQKFIGQISNIVFVGDDDGQRVGQNVVFKPLVFNEGGIDVFDDVPAQRAFDDDVNLRGSMWLNGQTEQLHTFHDVGDVDWTIIYTPSFLVRTESIGAQADSKLTVYEWTDAEYDANLGYFTSVTDVRLSSPGISQFVVHGTEFKTYAIKTEANNSALGSNSAYKLILEAAPEPPQFQPDIADNVPAQRAFNDDVNLRGLMWTGIATNDVVHNFHDTGDVDWTIVSMAEDFTVSTNNLGANSETKIELYKWISATYDFDLGYFTSVNDVLLDESSNPWNTPLKNWSNSQSTYAVKVESLNGNVGLGTDYKLVFSGLPDGIPDAYDVPSSNGHTDDIEGTPTFWTNSSTEQIHNFHDNNDVDWTLVYAPVPGSFTAFAQVVGEDADITMTVYKWLDADVVNGIFVNIERIKVGDDDSEGNSIVSFNVNEAASYVIKVESRNGAFGNGTSYKLKVF